MCGPHLSVFLGTRQLGLGVVCGCLLRREQALPIGTVTRMVSAGVQIGCVWATPICFLGTRQLGLGVVCGCLLRREQTLPIGTVTRMVSAGVQIGCVWATPICFLGTRQLGLGVTCGWLLRREQALQGGEFAHKQCKWWFRAHIRSWWSW